jgi:hypothetical protein
MRSYFFPALSSYQSYDIKDPQNRANLSDTNTKQKITCLTNTTYQRIIAKQDLRLWVQSNKTSYLIHHSISRGNRQIIAMPTLTGVGPFFDSIIK